MCVSTERRCLLAVCRRLAAAAAVNQLLCYVASSLLLSHCRATKIILVRFLGRSCVVFDDVVSIIFLMLLICWRILVIFLWFLVLMMMMSL